MSRRAKLDAAPREKIAVGYVRVSTRRQELEGLSLGTQEDRIRAWATIHGYTMLEIVREALSGKSMDRPGLQRALDIACTRRAAFVVCKLDRFARNTKDALMTAERLNESGADFVSLAEQFDTTTAMGELFFTVVAGLATFERRRIAERTVEVLDGKRERGEALGNVPFGYRSTGPRGMLEPDEREQGVLEAMMAAWRERKSYAHVVRTLNAAGLLSRADAPWRRGQVRRIILAQAVDKAAA